MAEGEETDEHCRARVEKDALNDTLKTENAALKAMELEFKRLSQSGEAVMWAELPKELLGMVMEKLQPPEPAGPLAEGWGGSKHVRLVSREWRDCHDALVTRLRLSRWTTDEGMWLLVRRFPAVVSLEMQGDLTDKGLKAVSNLTGLTSLDVSCITPWCYGVTNKGLRALSSFTGLTSLNLRGCNGVTDKGLQALSSLTGLTSLNLFGCSGVTDKGVAALRRNTASSNVPSSALFFSVLDLPELWQRDWCGDNRTNFYSNQWQAAQPSSAPGMPAPVAWNRAGKPLCTV